MKIALITAMALVSVSSFPLHSQQTAAPAPQTQAQQSVQATAGSRSVGESSSSSLTASRTGGVNAQNTSSTSASGPETQVNGELTSKLDAKSARVGDPVVVKTTQTAKTANGTEIPKGSRLIGHVTSVQAHGKGSEDSSVAIAFDHAELRNGQTMPIHSVIHSVSPAAGVASSAMAGDDMSMGEPMGGGIRGGGVARGAGGLGSGLVGGATGAVDGTVRGADRSIDRGIGATGSGIASTTGSVAHDTAGETSHLAGSATTTAGNGLHGTANGTGALAAHATAVPGVMLAGDASGSTAGTLSAARRNVHLDSGTQMVLGVSSSINR